MYHLLYDIWQETRFYYCQPYKRIYKFTLDLFLVIGSTYLKLKLFKWKIPFKALYLSKGNKKVKDFQKTSTNKEIYFIF